MLKSQGPFFWKLPTFLCTRQNKNFYNRVNPVIMGIIAIKNTSLLCLQCRFASLSKYMNITVFNMATSYRCPSQTRIIPCVWPKDQGQSIRPFSVLAWESCLVARTGSQYWKKNGNSHPPLTIWVWRSDRDKKALLCNQCNVIFNLSPPVTSIYL